MRRQSSTGGGDIAPPAQPAIDGEAGDPYETAPAGLLMLDADGVILRANRMAGAILGDQPTDLVGRSLLSFIKVDGHELFRLHHRALARTGCRQEFYLQRGGPDPRHLLVTSMAVTDRPGAAHLAISDVTAIKTLEQRLLQLNEAERAANDAKTRLLATMNHEIRTPLSAIATLGDIMTRTPLNARQAELVGVLRKSAECMLTIVGDMLDLAKLESGRLVLESAPFDLFELLEEVRQIVAVAASEKGVYVWLDYDSRLPQMFMGDVGRLRQIFLNLAGNAVKFTASGSVVIRAAGLPSTDGRKALTVEVIDTGIGISQEMCARIFDSYVQAETSTTRKFGGTGLGLAICKQLTEHMGGRLSVVSELGRGSVFTVSLVMPVSVSAGRLDPSSGHLSPETGSGEPVRTPPPRRPNLHLVANNEPAGHGDWQ